MDKELQRLYQGFVSNTLSIEELEEFINRVNDYAYELQINQLMDSTWQNMFEKEKAVIIKKLPFYQRSIFRYVAAASVILIITLGFILGLFQHKIKQQVISNNQVDITAPKNNRAVITLSSGVKLY